MTKQVRSSWFISAVILFLSAGIALNAQQTTPQSGPTSRQAQSPATPDQAQPNQTPSQTPDQAEHQAPDSQGPAAQSPDVPSDRPLGSASGSAAPGLESRAIVLAES